jgi:hypothetical protein
MRGTLGTRRDGYTGYSCLDVVGPTAGSRALVGAIFWKAMIRGDQTGTCQSALMLSD